MTIEVTDLTELDATDVQTVQETLAQLMAEYNPTLDTKYGVLHDLLFYNEAIYAAKNAEELARLRRSMSLLEIAQDPDLADDDLVDEVASNYRIERRAGTNAEGDVMIIVSELQTVAIPEGDVWEASGKQFTSPAAYTARTSSSNVQSSTDRVLTPLPDGNYAFSVKLVAAESGAASQVVQDTAFVPQSAPINFVQAYAAEDFVNGRDTETNDDLAGRAIEGMACKALSGSTNMSAALKDENQGGFTGVIADSVIGFGDAEMLRDQHSIFPGSMGGRVDWYVRGQKQVQNVGIDKTATLVELTATGTSIWQFNVGRDDLPGFYDVKSVLPLGVTSATGYRIASDVRSLDMTALDNDGFLPDINATIEGVYSRFQAAVVQFEDTDKAVADLTVGDTATYRVTLRGQPQIDEMQDWASSRGVRNRAGDALVKAPVPCFLRISFTIELHPGASTPDTDAIANNLADLVNTYGFTGVLPASAMSDVIHNSLTGRTHLSAIDIMGDIRRPDGTIRRLRTTEIYEVPDEPQYMTTGRTVAFFLDPADVAVSVQTADIPEI
jgi:hypothetical protein